jgi:hypothetical protein
MLPLDDGRLVLANFAYDAWGHLVSGSNPTPYGYKAQWGYTTNVETGERRLDGYLRDTYAWWYAKAPTIQIADKDAPKVMARLLNATGRISPERI